MVGQGEEQQRFVIPVIYINHPLFMQLLKEAEEEYGFDHKGPITIPCHVEEFRTVQGMTNNSFLTQTKLADEINITDLQGGKVGFGSAAPGSKLDSSYTKS